MLIHSEALHGPCVWTARDRLHDDGELVSLLFSLWNKGDCDALTRAALLELGIRSPRSVVASFLILYYVHNNNNNDDYDNEP